MFSNLFWVIALVGGALIGEAAWSEFRDFQARRQAMKHGRPLTTKYGLPWR